MCRESVLGLGTRARNGRSARSSDEAGPVHVTEAKSEGPEGWVRPPSSFSVDQSRRSAFGTVASQAGTTVDAAENGQARKARVIGPRCCPRARSSVYRVLDAA